MRDVGQCPFAAGVHDVAGIHEDLRTSAPGVHRAQLPDGSPVWLVTGWSAVTKLLADPRVSASKAASTTGFTGQSLPPALDANLLNIDGDQHRRVRRLAAESFAPAQHPAQERLIAAAVTELVDALPATGTIDVMSGVCEPLPPRIIGTLLGLPADELDAFRKAAQPMFVIDDAQPEDTLRTSMATMLMLVASVIEDKRNNPAGDLLSQWVRARDGEDRLTDEELIGLAFAMIVGGFEIVTALCSIVLDEVIRTRETRARELLDSPAEFGRMVREVMREVAPMNYAVRRFPLTDLEVNGVRIPKGHTVMLSLRSAHLDPAGHGRPDLVFGHGWHYCLGATLAEMQTVHIVRAMLRRYPVLRPVKPRTGYRLRPTWLTYSLAELSFATN